MLDRLTKETFVPVTGTLFQLAIENGPAIPLELVEVAGNGLQGRARREQFSLRFRGPATPALVQRIYRLEHATLGALEIFLVPIQKDSDGMIYEAVFT